MANLQKWKKFTTFLQALDIRKNYTRVFRGNYRRVPLMLEEKSIWTVYIKELEFNCLFCSTEENFELRFAFSFGMSWGVVGWGKGVVYHWGVQLILAYSYARPAILAAGKGREGIFLFLLFLHFHSFSFLPCPSLSSPLLSLLFIFSLSVGDNTKWPTRLNVSLNPNSINWHVLVFAITVCKWG